MNEREDLAAAFRHHRGKAVAVVMRMTRDLDLAEDAVQDAFVQAASTFVASGVPDVPEAWIIATAKKRAIDLLRREGRRPEKERAGMPVAAEPAPPTGPVDDDRLRLIFTCCHYALAMEARVALTLRMLGGLTTGEIAAAFLVPETTMGQRISRAKSKIREARIPYRVPGPDDLPERLGGVLAVVYLIFNEGYLASSGDRVVRSDLCDEAIRLARLVVDLCPDQPEAKGLLALLLLQDSRRGTRAAPDGRLIPLAEQDRSRWDGDRSSEGRTLALSALAAGSPGPYQLQAAIAAVHSEAPDAASTDWPQILGLYRHLYAISPTPTVFLNATVALAEVHGPEVALSQLDAGNPPATHLTWAFWAQLLERLGRFEDAADAYDRALDLVENEAERDLLATRRAGLPGLSERDAYDGQPSSGRSRS